MDTDSHNVAIPVRRPDPADTTDPQPSPAAQPQQNRAADAAAAPTGAQLTRQGLALVGTGLVRCAAEARTGLVQRAATRADQRAASRAATRSGRPAPTRTAPGGAAAPLPARTPMRKRAERMALWAVIATVAYVAWLHGPVSAAVAAIGRATSPTVSVTYTPVITGTGQAAHPAPVPTTAGK